jgi:hypothetical protein
VHKLMQGGWSVSDVARRLHALGPYLLIELLLPGGTLVALLVYVCQHQRPILALAFARVGMPRMAMRCRRTLGAGAAGNQNRSGSSPC